MHDLFLSAGGTERFGRHDFPVIDFKFRNSGNATSLITEYRIDILYAEVDPTPRLRFKWGMIPNSEANMGSGALAWMSHTRSERSGVPGCYRSFDRCVRSGWPAT